MEEFLLYWFLWEINNVYRPIGSAQLGCTIYGFLVGEGGGEGERVGRGWGKGEETLFGAKGN